MRGTVLLTASLLTLLVAGSAGSAPPLRLVPTEIAFWDAHHGLGIFTRPLRCKGEGCAAIGRTDDGGRTWTLTPIDERWTDLVVAPGRRAWALRPSPYRR